MLGLFVDRFLICSLSFKLPCVIPVWLTSHLVKGVLYGNHVK